MISSISPLQILLQMVDPTPPSLSSHKCFESEKRSWNLPQGHISSHHQKRLINLLPVLPLSASLSLSLPLSIPFNFFLLLFLFIPFFVSSLSLFSMSRPHICFFVLPVLSFSVFFSFLSLCFLFIFPALSSLVLSFSFSSY
jgi:hypothetical protein